MYLHKMNFLQVIALAKVRALQTDVQTCIQTDRQADRQTVATENITTYRSRVKVNGKRGFV